MNTPASGSIVIHAGMGKSGSSSIQAWLARMSGALLEQHGIGVLHAVPQQKKQRWSVEVRPCGDNDPVANALVRRYFNAATDKRDFAGSFTQALLRAAEKYRLSVLTAEAFSLLFCNGDEIFLSALDELAASADVRVVYYARPQHKALESAWRQWGFRKGQCPSHFIRGQSKQMHYGRTVEMTQRLAPRLRFEVRPFVRKLLLSGDVVTDFGTHFLGLGQDQIGDVPWSNRSLPLEAVNLLRHAPAGMFWRGPHDNRNLTQIRHLLADIAFSPDDRIKMSRRLLQKYCFDVFESENRKMIKKSGWDIDCFVPSPDLDISADECLSLIDRHWEPGASENELAIFFGTLKKALG